MTIHHNAAKTVTYLDMEAQVGITKHLGGMDATNELLALCHIEAANTVLNVGCGIGVGSTHIAKKYDSRVVGVDISPKMIEWSRQRARQERVETKVDGLTANVLALPFPDDRFDIVLCESVLIFVDDKAQAIRECMRVTKPGGYVGLNEGFWTAPPPPESVTRVKDAIGPSIPTLETWQALWAASGLRDRTVKTYPLEAGAEVKSRIQWIGWPWLLRAWWRGLRLYLTQPELRQPINAMVSSTSDIFRYLGYGLFIGQKPNAT